MKITDLEKKIGNFCLQIDHLDIEPGRIHGIIGPNGCGKTVLLKILAGIYTPDSGIIDYEGIGFREITMLSQRPYLMDASVYKNLIYPLQIRHILRRTGDGLRNRPLFRLLRCIPIPFYLYQQYFCSSRKSSGIFSGLAT